jgi:hypothetical protein
MNFEKMATAHAQAAGDYRKGADEAGKSKFMKFVLGTNNVRIIPHLPQFPDGKPIDDVPYAILRQHCFQVFDEQGRKSPRFAICYNQIASHTQTLAQYLVRQGKLTSDRDIRPFKQFGCPTCVAVSKLREAGVPDTVWKEYSPREVYRLAILSRADGMPYVWNMSKSIFEGTLGQFLQMLKHPTQPQNIWDINSGWDTIVTQTRVGQGPMGVRYRVNYSPIPSPLNFPEGETIPNLYELSLLSFMAYPELADKTNQAMGLALNKLGHTVSGTSTDNILSVPPPSQVIPGYAVPQPIASQGVVVTENVLYVDGQPIF